MRGLVKSLISTFILSVALLGAGYFGMFAVKADTIKDLSGSLNKTFNIVTIAGIALLIAAIIIFLWIIFKPIKEE